MAKFKLDQATKDSMVGLFPVNNDFTVTYTPDEYKTFPTEIQPVFILKPWSEKECKEMGKLYEKEPDQDDILDRVRKQIVGLNNLLNLSDETEIKYEADNKGGISTTLFSMLPIVVKTSILYRLLKISGIQV